MSGVPGFGDPHLPTELVSGLIRDHLQVNPRTAAMLQRDANARHAFEGARVALVAVVETLRQEGNPPHVAATLIRATLPRLIGDDLSVRDGGGVLR